MCACRGWCPGKACLSKDLTPGCSRWGKHGAYHTIYLFWLQNKPNRFPKSKTIFCLPFIVWETSTHQKSRKTSRRKPHPSITCLIIINIWPILFHLYSYRSPPCTGYSQVNPNHVSFHVQILHYLYKKQMLLKLLFPISGCISHLYSFKKTTISGPLQ